MNTLIAIKSCQKHWDRVAVQRETWADYHVTTFTGFDLNVPDDYPNLPFKTQAICRWALKRNHDFAHLTDTDTYVALDRLLSVVPTDYLGREHYEGKNYALGGPGYWLSAKAMEILANAKCWQGNEDEWVGWNLAEAGIKLTHDPRYSIYTPCLPGNDVITQHLTGNHPYDPEMMRRAHVNFLDKTKE